MTDLYEQKVEKALPISARIKQIIAVALFLIGLGLVAVVVAVSYYVAVAVVVLIALSFVVIYDYNKNVVQYIYGANTNRIVFSFTNVVNKTIRAIEIAYDKVIEFSIFDDLVSKADIVMCPNPQENGVRTLVFDSNGKKQRVIFAPDDYLTAFIKEILQDKKQCDRFPVRSVK